MTAEDISAIVAAVVAALKATQGASPPQSPVVPLGPTIGAVFQEYLASADYRGLAEASKPPYKRVLLRWIRQHDLGARPIVSLTRQDVERHLAKESAGAAGFLLRRLRVLTKFALVRVTSRPIRARASKCHRRAARGTLGLTTNSPSIAPIGLSVRASDLLLNSR
jgi:hypothetical protein